MPAILLLGGLFVALFGMLAAKVLILIFIVGAILLALISSLLVLGGQIVDNRRARKEERRRLREAQGGPRYPFLALVGGGCGVAVLGLAVMEFVYYSGFWIDRLMPNAAANTRAGVLVLLCIAALIAVPCIIGGFLDGLPLLRKKVRLEVRRERLERRQRGEPITVLDKLRYERHLSQERRLAKARARDAARGDANAA